ncbi:hypothetical protein KSS87_010088, partial [Heliosperma pusillum]
MILFSMQRDIVFYADFYINVILHSLNEVFPFLKLKYIF